MYQAAGLRAVDRRAAALQNRCQRWRLNNALSTGVRVLTIARKKCWAIVHYSVGEVYVRVCGLV